MHLLAAGRGFRPAVIAGEVGCDHLQSVAVRAAAAQAARARALGRRAHRRAHRTPLPQQRRDQLRPHVAVSAGHQNTGSSRAPPPSAGRSSCTRWFASASASASPRSRASHSAAFSCRYSRWMRSVAISASIRSAWRSSRSRCSPAAARDHARGWPGRCACPRSRPPSRAGKPVPAACRGPRRGSGGARCWHHGRSARSARPPRSSATSAHSARCAGTHPGWSELSCEQPNTPQALEVKLHTVPVR